MVGGPGRRKRRRPPAQAAGKASVSSNPVRCVLSRGRAGKAYIHPQTGVGVLLGMYLRQPVEAARRSVLGVRDKDPHPLPSRSYATVDLLHQPLAVLNGAYHDSLRMIPAKLRGTLERDQVHLVDAHYECAGAGPVLVRSGKRAAYGLDLLL